MNKYNIENSDLISKPPSWLTRWGIIIISFTVVLFLAMSWIIKYPDVVNGGILITSTTPPANVPARAAGKISKLFIKNNAIVNEGDYLAAIENSANLNDILFLKKEIELLHIDSLLLVEPLTKSKSSKLLLLHLSRMLHVGEIQNYYNQFYDALKKHQIVIADKSYNKIAIALQNQLHEYESLNAQIDEQNKIISQKTDLEKSKLTKDELLRNEKILSSRDLEESRKRYYDQLVALKNNQSLLTQNMLRSKEYEKNLVQNEKSYRDQLNESITNVRTSYELLSTELYRWEQKYIIKSPISGKANMMKYWAENQFVNDGDLMFTVVPASQNLLGKALIPVQNSGKLKIGQEAKIKLDNFPFQEFGIIRGTVTNISAIPIDGKYIVDIQLTSGNVTTYNKKLPDGVEFQGNVDIITQDVRLIQKIFEPFRNLKNNQ